MQKYKSQFLANPNVLGIFVALLKDPLSKSSVHRDDRDHHTLELVLTFFRNLLAIGPANPLEDKRGTGPEQQQQLIQTFGDEMVLNLVAHIGQTIERKEHEKLDLSILEVRRPSERGRENENFEHPQGQPLGIFELHAFAID